jgi:NRPS condensation-like uncharacterized protein
VNDQWNFLLKTIWDQMIHLVIRFEGHIDEKILDLAVRQALSAEPLTGMKFTPGDPPFLEPACPDPGMPAWAGSITTTTLDQTLEEVLAFPLDPLTGPMARIRLLRSDDDLLCISFNHTITDAYGVKSFGSLIARLYRSALCEGEFLPVKNSHDRSFHGIISLFSADECREASGQLGTGKGAWKIPFSSYQTGKRQYATHTIGKESFSRIRDYTRTHGITVNDLLLASYVLALAESAPVPIKTKTPVLTSIDLRRYLSPDMYPSIANLSVAFELPVVIPPEPDFPEIVQQVHDLMNGCKSGHAGIGAARRLCREFDSGFLHAEKELVLREEKTRDELLWKNPFFTNLGIIPEGVIEYGVPVRDAWMLGPVEYPPGFCLAASTFRGSLTLSAGFSGEAMERDWVFSLLSSVARYLCRFSSLV